MRLSIPASCALAVALAAPASLAQSPVQASPPIDVSAGGLLRGAAGISEDDGHLWAIGEDWRAELLADGIEFTPCLGKLEPVTRHLRYRLTAVGRDDSMRPAAAPTRRAVDGLEVTFERGDVQEVYEAKPEGLKQSFVFAHKPQGSGDLVVRGQLSADMDLVSTTATELLFHGTAGGVSVGRVIGFDARGERCDGVLQLDGTTLELRLPAAFVDAAVAPITVDPLIGTVFNVDGNNEYQPDVAYDLSNDRWLVVFHRATSLVDWDIIGRFVESDGSLGASAIGIRNGNEGSAYAHVANNNLRDRFVVAWEEDPNFNGVDLIGDIYARTVSALDGSLGTVKTIATDAEDETNVDVGGNTSDVDDSFGPKVMLGFTRAADLGTTIYVAGRVMHTCLTINTDGTLSMGTLATLSRDLDANRVGISIASNESQYWMLTWDMWAYDPVTNTAISNGPRDIWADVRDANLSSLSGEIEVQAGDFMPQTLYWYFPAAGSVYWGESYEPEVAGDGKRFLVAYSVRPFTGTIGNGDDVYATTIEYSPRHNTWEVLRNLVTVHDSTSVRTRRASVARSNDSFLVTYINDTTGQVHVAELDFGCDRCGIVTDVATGSNPTYSFIASKTDGGSTDIIDEESLVAFSRDGTGDYVDAFRYYSNTGVSENLGGACGTGTTTTVATECAKVGFSGHTIRMNNARANETAVLVLGFEETSLSCASGCTLHVNPLTSLLFPFTTSATGTAQLDVAIPQIPELQGLSYYVQWVVSNVNGSSNCAELGADFTDGKRVTIQ